MAITLTARATRLAPALLLASAIAGCGSSDAAVAPASTPTDSGATPVDSGAGAGALIDLVAIPAGEFVMGDHTGFVDPKHPSDELPLHAVSLRAFELARTETTCAQFLPFLHDALAAGQVTVADTRVVATADATTYLDTSAATAPSCITWDGSRFGVAPGREAHPISAVRWAGAAAYCNWYGAKLGLQPCYDLAAATTDATRTCVRLPTEAEWEYAGRGGLQSPYGNYPWGDATDDARVNWVGSNDPWEQGPQPLTTPVGFFDGSLRQRADYVWPSAMETYQTLDGRNGYGLYDMAGNVWEWVNDWYGRAYYEVSPAADPMGPAAGDPMPDGVAYHGLRGGSYFNSTVYRGDHERVSNRDPAYFRGKYLGVDDPNGPWFHIGFRVALQQR